MISFLRYIFHKYIPDPIVGQRWRYRDANTGRELNMTISEIDGIRIKYYTTKNGPSSAIHEKPIRDLKAFYRLVN